MKITNRLIRKLYKCNIIPCIRIHIIYDDGGSSISYRFLSFKNKARADEEESNGYWRVVNTGQITFERGTFIRT